MSSTISPLLRTDLDGVFRPRVGCDLRHLRPHLAADRREHDGAGRALLRHQPDQGEACGIRCYPSMADCPDVPEMVVMGVGHGRIEAAIEDVLSVPGVRAIITPGLGNEAGR